MSEYKPREFWITDNTDNSGWSVETAYEKKTMFGSGNVFHVIEFSAYGKSEAKLAIAIEALESIGCNKTFHSLGGIDDCARCLALIKIKGIE